MMIEKSKSRTRTNDPKGMRQKLLDIAAETFQARGYHATSLGDLMQAAGVSGGALHHHFPTKKAIGLAVIEERVTVAVEETWIAPMRGAANAREGVGAVFTAVADELDAQGFVRGCPLNNLAHELSLADPDFRVALARVFGRWQQAVADRIDGDARLPAADRDGLAVLVVAAYSGAMSLAKASQSAEPLRACLKELDRLLADDQP